MSSSKKVVLESSDGVTFEVEAAVMLESQMIKGMVNSCDDNVIHIPIPNVNSKILAKVIEYSEKHVKNPVVDEELKSWDEDFVKVDQSTLFDLILAANHLEIKSLLDLTTQTTADMIKGKTPEELRKFFNTKEITPEEEEELRRTDAWAFE